jgi:hypothetical protein
MHAVSVIVERITSEFDQDISVYNASTKFCTVIPCYILTEILPINQKKKIIIIITWAFRH